jgi:putative acetyltransferase
MDWTIRQAKSADISQMIQLFYDTITRINGRDYTREQTLAWATAGQDEGRWESKIREQYFLVAEKDGIILGLASLTPVGYLDMLYVHHAFQRQSLAQSLFDALKKEADRLSIQEMTADVSITARPFFASQGFKLESKQQKMIQGQQLINYRMKKICSQFSHH